MKPAFGLECPAADPLPPEEVMALPDTTLVLVKWSGGYAFLYRIQRDKWGSLGCVTHKTEKPTWWLLNPYHGHQVWRWPLEV